MSLTDPTAHLVCIDQRIPVVKGVKVSNSRPKDNEINIVLFVPRIIVAFGTVYFGIPLLISRQSVTIISSNNVINVGSTV